MKIEKSKQEVIYDERQQQIQLKSYALSFWFVMAILYIATLGKPNLLLNIAFWGGLTLNVCYSTLKGASPFVDQRFGKFAKIGRWIGLPVMLLGAGVLIITVIVGFVKHTTLKEFLDMGSFLWVSALSLICMGASIFYRNYRNKKEADE